MEERQRGPNEVPYVERGASFKTFPEATDHLLRVAAWDISRRIRERDYPILLVVTDGSRKAQEDVPTKKDVEGTLLRLAKQFPVAVSVHVTATVPQRAGKQP